MLRERSPALRDSGTSRAARAGPLDMPPLYLIDGFNFLHAVVLEGRERDNWWSVENQRRVVSRVAELGAAIEAFEAWVVFDRRDTAAEAGSQGGALVSVEQGIQIHAAADADDYIVARCTELTLQREVRVVSADRSLVDRARHRGARGVSPWAFAGGNARAPAQRGSDERGR